MKKILLCVVVHSLVLYSAETVIKTKEKELTVHIGGFSVQGTKQRNDDRYAHSSLQIVHDKKVLVSGVFDGHGNDSGQWTSSDVSEMAHKRFFEKFSAWVTANKCVSQATFKAAINACEKRTWKAPIMFASQGKHVWQDAAVDCLSGSTVLVSCFEYGNNILHIAWLGDSRGVFGGKKYFCTTKDHRPIDAAEQEYIKKFGGFVSNNHDGAERVCNDLAMSRALGDIHLKKCLGSGPLSAIPSYYAQIMTEDVEYYLEASDGFWDVVRNEEVFALIQDCLLYPRATWEKKYPVKYLNINENGYESRKELLWRIQDGWNLADIIAARLVYIAVLNRGSTDDTTVVVKLFDWKQKQDANSIEFDQTTAAYPAICNLGEMCGMR
jgi:serine/threonine protein phosphatase PrpC